MSLPAEVATAVAAIGAPLIGLPVAPAVAIAGVLAEIAEAISKSDDPEKAAEHALIAVQAKLAYRAAAAAAHKVVP